MGEIRVALVLATATGGLGRHVASLARGLVARGYAVSVHGPAATAALHGLDRIGATFHPLEIPGTLRLGDLRTASPLRRALREDPPDLVHAHGLRAGLVAALARDNQVPLVVSWHNQAREGGLRGVALRGAERYVARHSEVTLASTPELVTRADSMGARDVRLVEVAAPALGPATRTPEDVRAEFGRPERPLIVSVGRLHPQKRLDVLVDAAAHWRPLTPTPLVVVAGTGPAYRDLAARISAARAPVTLLGHRDDIADLLGAADLAVISSDWEARQLFAQEALAAGVPLVATAVGGLPDLVGDAAVLIPPDSPEALDEAVRRLLADPALRARYAAAGRARAATWPTESDTIEAVTAVYAGVVPAGSR